MYEVILYDTEDGRCPVQDLLKIAENTKSRKGAGKNIRKIMNGGMAMSSYKAYKQKHYKIQK